MQRSKLIKSLKSLSKEEWTRFIEFVSSPFFNTQPKTLALAKLIHTCAPNLDQERLNKAHVFTQLFPGKPYKEELLRLEMSYLFGLLKEFWALAQFEQDPWKKEIATLAQFRKRKLEPHFDMQFRAIEKEFNSYSYYSEDFHYKKHLLYTQHYLRSVDIGERNKRAHDPMSDLDLNFLYVSLHNACDVWNRKHFFSGSYDFHMLEEILAFLKKPQNPYASYPPIQIWYKILLCLMDTENEHNFPELKVLLEAHHKRFLPLEATTMYRYALNYCIIMINKGHGKYLGEAFKIYKDLINNGLIYINGQMEHSDFKNIATSGLREKEYDWVHEFIHEHKERVKPLHRENVFNFCLANYYSETHQYRKAIRLLQTVQFTDIHYQLSSRFLLLRTYFEMEEWEDLLYQIDTFLIFLRRNKAVSSLARSNYVNHLKVLKKIVQLYDKRLFLSSTDFNKKSKSIQETLAAYSHVHQRNWLNQKLSALTQAD